MIGIRLRSIIYMPTMNIKSGDREGDYILFLWFSLRLVLKIGSIAPNLFVF